VEILEMGSITRATVNLEIQQNATMQDAFQFGTPGDTSWSFTGMSFIMEVKASRDEVGPVLLTLSTGLGSIVVDDVVQRVLHFNVPDTAIQSALPIATYVYDLIQFDTSTPPIRTPLMGGHLKVTQGVTLD
jgi:hypothetical protein